MMRGWSNLLVNYRMRLGFIIDEKHVIALDIRLWCFIFFSLYRVECVDSWLSLILEIIKHSTVNRLHLLFLLRLLLLILLFFRKWLLLKFLFISYKKAITTTVISSSFSLTYRGFLRRILKFYVCRWLILLKLKFLLLFI